VKSLALRAQAKRGDRQGEEEVTQSYHQRHEQPVPREGTRTRVLWDRLHAHPDEWIEFTAEEYNANYNALYKVAQDLRNRYGLDLRCLGHRTCKWMMVTGGSR
jgi:hypothetical protein